MPTSPSGKRIDAIVSRGVAPLLKANAYRKERNHFFRAAPAATSHLAVQASQWNAPDRARFTINLWSYLPAIAEAKGETVSEDPRRQRMGHCGIRIGHLFPEPRDFWWETSTDEEIDSVADAVASAVERFALPYLSQVATLEGVAELAGYIPGIGPQPTESKAIALRLLGHEQQAIQVEAALQAQREAARQRLQQARLAYAQRC